MKTLLITGGAGFIGSNFIIYLLDKYPEYRIINIDKLTYAGTLKNLSDVTENPRHVFLEGSICDPDLLTKIFNEYSVNDVIHLAAESHVDNSISGPRDFVETNLVGTFNLLETARKTWMQEPGVYKSSFVNSRFHHVSTDEVYGSLGEKGLFTENNCYAPNSPYSATKAGSDMLVRSYHHTYGMNTVISNCSNNYGPRQHSEKLIPTVIRKALTLEKIPIYGNGKNIRDWLYVADHCSGLDLVFHKGKSGEVYNIGGRNECSNINIVETICDFLDKKKPRLDHRSYRELISFVKDRPGHDFRYAIDASKIVNELGWNSSENFKSGLEKTVDWYIRESENI